MSRCWLLFFISKTHSLPQESECEGGERKKPNKFGGASEKARKERIERANSAVRHI